MASRLIGVTAVTAVLAAAIVLCLSSSAGALAPTTTNTIIDVAGTTTPVTGPLPLGSSVVDTATVGPQTTPVASGTVTYTLYEGACGDTSTPIYSDPGETLDSGGNVPNSTASPALGAGSYYYTADYSGDATYASSSDTCEAFSVNKGDLTLSTSAYLSTDPGQSTAINNTSIGLGSSVFDQATLSGAASGISPAGTVSYTFFTNGTCNATGSAAGSSAPPPTVSNTEGPLGTGNYSFSSTYSGDANYNTISSSLCESFSVGMQSTSTSTTIDKAGTTTPVTAPLPLGSSVVDTASVGPQTTPVASGTVTYSLYEGACGDTSTPIYSDPGVVLDSGGNVPNSTASPALKAGSYYYTASYSGDGNYGVSSDTCEVFSVNKGDLTLSTSAYLSTDPGQSTAINNTSIGLGTSVFDQATLSDAASGISPAGTVSYTFFTNGTCNATGSAAGSSAPPPTVSNTEGPLATGNYSFSATYSGDANYNTISSSLCEAFSVNKGNLTLSTSAYLSTDPGQSTAINNTSIGLGSSVFDQATLSNAASGISPAGTVSYTFFTNGTCNATGSAAGSSALPPTVSNTEGPLATGNYSFSATYSGDANYNTISSSLCEAFSVALVGTSTSTGVEIASSDAPVKGALPLGSSVIDTATVGPQTTPVASGTVTYTLYEGACGVTSTPIYSKAETLDSGGNVPNSTASPELGAGSYFYAASYSGDGNYGASSDSCEAFTVNKGAPSLTTKVYLSTDGGESSPINGANVPFGSSVYDQATLSGVTTGFVPTGSVSYTFFTNGSCSNSGTTQTLNVIGGNVQRSAVSSTGAIGSYAFEAVYNGDANYPAENAGCEAFSVGRAASTTPSITNLPFNPLAEGGFTATVSTNGDGTRSVVSSTTGVCTVGNNGLTVSYVAPGSCTLTAQVAQGATHLYATGSPQTFTILRVPHGYWLVGSDGGIFTFGDSQFWGSTGNLRLQRPVVGITPTVSRNGYWLVASDGGIFSFGDSGFYGSIPGLGLHPAGSGAAPSLNAPIVAMVPSTTGHGYFMVASDGGVFAFGDARFAGSCPGIGGCSGAAVAVVPDATGKGYWLFTNTGNVYTFGDAPYYGAPPATGVPVTSAVATPDGHGYWILFSNGEVASFGDAPGLGSPVGYTNSANPATAIFPTANGGGYWVGSARGDVFAFGDAPFLGSMAGTVLNGMIIAASGY